MNENMVFNIPVINELNAVEGFNPVELLRKSGSDAYDKPLAVDVEYKKLWFRLKYPLGKITKTIVNLTEQIAVVEARVYTNKDDGPEHFISNAFAQKYRDAAENSEMSCLELAETAAIGKALDDAGFGIQFCCLADNAVTGTTSTGITATQSATQESPATPAQSGQPDLVPQNQQGTDSAQQIQAAAQTQPASQNQPAQQEQPTPQNQSEAVDQNNAPVQQPVQDASIQQYDSQTPVEDIVKMMDLEEAKNVIVPSGLHKGKTFAKLAIQKPSTLEWYISSYAGNDDILRAAATVLVNAAIGQAS